MLNGALVIVIAIVAYYFIIFSKKVKKSVTTLLLSIILYIFNPVNTLTLENIGKIISFETLGILFGMMIIVEFLKESGFFTFSAVWVIKASKAKFWAALFSLMLITALFSAFLDNLITILFISPIIFLITDTLEIDAAPFIMLTIFIDNIGGMSTLIGSPLNIVLGSISKLDFTQFMKIMSVIAFITFISTFTIFRKKYTKAQTAEFSEKLKRLGNMKPEKAITNKKLLLISIIVFALVLTGFIFSSTIKINSALIAVFGGLILLFVFNHDFASFSSRIDWDTMFFYAGLFSISYALDKIGVTQSIAWIFKPLIGAPVILMLCFMWLSAFVIPFLSAVPGTLLLAPVVKILIGYGAPAELWYAYAVGANLGSNFTPLGAVQNIVGVSLLEKHGGKSLSFSQFMNYSKKTFLVSLILGTFFVLGLYFVKF
jgi:Na+/H+ antiporter NhaD/arsenite permease-like protein